MWTRTRTALIFAATLALLGACKNKQHCEGNPHDDCRLDDAQPSCSTSDQCAAPTSVCDPEAMACVQCTPAEAGACMGATPVCGADHQCRACSAHAECSMSNACLPAGRCADPGEVAYVQLNGTGGQPCAKAAPCGTLQEAVTAVSASRPYVRILGTGTLTPSATTTIDGKAVTILADPGAKLDRMGDGVNLEVRNTGADVRIYDLEIIGASGGPSDVGIFAAGGTPKLTLTRVKVTNNIGGGISMTGGVLTVSQSTISGNQGGGISMTGGALTVSQSTISGNQGGGISISSAEFDLANNFIVGNGGVGAVFGGVRFDQTNTGIRRFEFNTVTENVGMAGFTIGVVCTLVGQPVTFSNNIVYDNQVGGGRTQVGGMNCSWTYSDIGPDTVVGMGNINMTPMFKDLTRSDYHLQSGSPAKDAADPVASLAIDIDSDPRPQGTRRDMGADEIR
jgi:hypothetical protein